jgi:hypothetical protein
MSERRLRFSADQPCGNESEAVHRHPRDQTVCTALFPNMPALHARGRGRCAALEHAEHLRPYRYGGKKQAQRGQRDRFLKNRPDHDCYPAN